MPPSTAAVAVDCYVRASSRTDAVDATIERLREDDRTDVIDELTVQSWPAQVSLGDDAGHADIVERFETFRAWADSHDVYLPSFEIREQTSLVDDETTPTVVLPVCCVAIHVDGTLASVVPHRTETTMYTVDEALSDLDARDVTHGIRA